MTGSGERCLEPRLAVAASEIEQPRAQRERGDQPLGERAGVGRRFAGERNPASRAARAARAPTT